MRKTFIKLIMVTNEDVKPSPAGGVSAHEGGRAVGAAQLARRLSQVSAEQPPQRRDVAADVGGHGLERVARRLQALGGDVGADLPEPGERRAAGRGEHSPREGAGADPQARASSGTVKPARR